MKAVQDRASRVLIRESQDVHMLVMGSRGQGDFVRLLLGSVRAACAAHAEYPVLVIHTPKNDKKGND